MLRWKQENKFPKIILIWIPVKLLILPKKFCYARVAKLGRMVVNKENWVSLRFIANDKRTGEGLNNEQHGTTKWQAKEQTVLKVWPKEERNSEK